MSAPPSKLVPLEDAAELVPDGALLGLGGVLTSGAPMAFCRELARARRRDLDLVVPMGGMDVDWLVAAGCVRRILTAIVGFEGFGLAPAFRRAVERGEVAIEDWSELTLLCALQAAAAGVPFMPTRAGLGTEIPDHLPDRMQVRVDERTGRPYVACFPLAPDVAVVHVHEADVLGNARVDPKLVWLDGELAKASRTVVVTAERIVDTDTFRAAPERTTYPSYAVDHVVHAPRGAWPDTFVPDYVCDGDFYRDYVRAARDRAAFAALLDGVLGRVGGAS